MAAADAAKRVGITVFTVGVGSSGDLDEPLLRGVATAPDYYHRVLDAKDLIAMFAGRAGRVECLP